MTTAAAWEASPDRLPAEIVACLDSANEPVLAAQQLLLAIPEWKAPSEGGITASQTDVLAICRNDKGLCIICVEAKVLEDFGVANKLSGDQSNYTRKSL